MTFANISRAGADSFDVSRYTPSGETGSIAIDLEATGIYKCSGDACALVDLTGIRIGDFLLLLYSEEGTLEAVMVYSGES
jgi:hypothetical protein